MSNDVINTSALNRDDLVGTPAECVDTEQVALEFKDQALKEGNSPLGLLVYLMFGVFFGIVLIKAEIVSWYRIQEMFRFQSFHMYGIIGSAIVIAALCVQIIKHFDIRTLHGEPIEIAPKKWENGTRYWLGGIAFGLGWALVGACPGPIFALIGSGASVMFIALLGAMLGTYAYAHARLWLPH